MKKGRIHIGTSGWHYKHWIGPFYPEGTRNNEQLEFYLKHFKTVELNNPFYRLPSPGTFENWAKSVPAGFLFSIKGNRYVTHMKKLKVAANDLDYFFEGVGQLGKKAGPVLYQLPPRWKVNVERLKGFLDILPTDQRYTFEFRDHSWYREDIYELLRQHNCAFCIYELAGHQSPEEVSADFVYVRLHGPGGKYQGKYTQGTLKKWAKKCLHWQKNGKDVLVYFDNDQAGYAPANARELAEMTGAAG
ncbi:uncharacterized protein YecE (DUF72 family) [Anseongella ginsenosidimutans]|uniref:Uncharacterized protein YecE (DUF72 family) n=1 Tax=Anseongella ginsenosidimutans TaxID=496056 RepID=A0A4R3KNK8_9SPHI|nr:DUF72 domain-containing protein [Anseongella ginsenosidimutans]QEC52436.1 DUF72 domain-containing protein [Anseongella ginsenosidimutans]TCS85813.1 uncharacterized protein YecE (DUF72 family) [Anseongella ginsenosidimutans]